MWIKAKLDLWRKHPKVGGIHFIHLQPKFRNIGDELCSPKHYFRFEPGSARAIVGGGALFHSAEKMVQRFQLSMQESVLWGVGASVPFGTLKKVVQLPFAAWGIRDRDATDNDEHFVPCVSCFLPMLETAPSAPETLVFLNAANRISPVELQNRIQSWTSEHNFLYADNRVSQSELTRVFGRASHIITNSFHGAYWGLLSGRRVSLAGYSSKFTSLLAGFELEDSRLARYEKEDAEGLWNLLTDPHFIDSHYHLPDAQDRLHQFRQINVQFAQRLVDSGLLRGFQVKNRETNDAIGP